MGGKRHYIVQFCCLIGVLVATMLQGFTHAVPLKSLSQYTGNIQVQHCDLSFQNYLDGTYQNCLAQQARKHTGFREFYSRCYNQMAYDCFGKCANKRIVEGKNHEFFLTGHIDDVTGKLLRSKYGTVEAAKTIAQQNVRETLILMDTLRQHGTQFLFVVCPTKPAVYPEYLPEPYQDSLSDFCLADYYVQQFKEKGIPHIGPLRLCLSSAIRCIGKWKKSQAVSSRESIISTPISVQNIWSRMVSWNIVSTYCFL